MKGNRSRSSESPKRGKGETKRRPQKQHALRYEPKRHFRSSLSNLSNVPRGNTRIRIPSAQMTRQYNEMFGDQNVRVTALNKRTPTTDGLMERPASSWSGFYSKSIESVLQPHAFLRHSLLGGKPRPLEQSATETATPRSHKLVDDHHDFYKNADLTPMQSPESPLRGVLPNVATSSLNGKEKAIAAAVVSPPILNLRPFSSFAGSSGNHDHRHHHRLTHLHRHTQHNEAAHPKPVDTHVPRVQRQYDMDGNVDPVSEDFSPIEMNSLDVKPEAIREAQVAFKKTEKENRIKTGRDEPLRRGESVHGAGRENTDMKNPLHHKYTPDSSKASQDTGTTSAWPFSKNGRLFSTVADKEPIGFTKESENSTKRPLTQKGTPVGNQKDATDANQQRGRSIYDIMEENKKRLAEEMDGSPQVEPTRSNSKHRTSQPLSSSTTGPSQRSNETTQNSKRSISSTSTSSSAPIKSSHRAMIMPIAKGHVPRRNDIAFRPNHSWTTNSSITKTASDHGEVLNPHDPAVFVRRMVGKQSMYSHLVHHDYAGAVDLSKMGVGVNPDLDRRGRTHPQYPDSAAILNEGGIDAIQQFPSHDHSSAMVRKNRERIEREIQPLLKRYLTKEGKLYPPNNQPTSHSTRKDNYSSHEKNDGNQGGGAIHYNPQSYNDHAHHVPRPVGGTPHKLRSSQVTKEDRPGLSRRRDDFGVEYD